MSATQHIADLIYRDLDGNLSETEALELKRWRAENGEHEEFYEEVLDEEGLTGMIRGHHPQEQERVKENILKKMQGQLHFKSIPLYRRGFFRVAVAACIAALLLVGGYFVFFNKPDESTPVIAKTNDVEAPKTDKAVIQLADGSIIPVDSLSSYEQGNVTVTRMEDGRLVYSGLGTEVVFNTLSNPRGSKVIDMTLADGSRVWLNAGSSITYPVSFVSNERKVRMAGEAFLEVTHNPNQPFTVSKGDVNVQVLGTKFNVNAYEDESDIRVTLLEGSVKVLKGNSANMIKPGQQARITSDISIVNGVDLEQVMAWKNGSFKYTRTDLKVIMREIGRWYDVDVIYEGNIPVQLYNVGVPRTANVSEVLKGLEYTGAHFSVEGKKIVVRP